MIGATPLVPDLVLELVLNTAYRQILTLYHAGGIVSVLEIRDVLYE